MKPRAVEVEDLAEINGWLELRGSPKVSRDYLPPQGFIIPGVACGFLLKTPVGLAILEGYVTNPKARRDYREQALVEITDSLIAAAKIGRVKRLIALTSNKVISELCKEYEFTCLEETRVWGRDI